MCIPFQAGNKSCLAIVVVMSLLPLLLLQPRLDKKGAAQQQTEPNKTHGFQLRIFASAAVIQNCPLTKLRERAAFFHAQNSFVLHVYSTRGSGRF